MPGALNAVDGVLAKTTAEHPAVDPYRLRDHQNLMQSASEQSCEEAALWWLCLAKLLCVRAGVRSRGTSRPGARLSETCLTQVGQWPIRSRWSSNGTMSRTMPVSYVVASTSPMPSAPSSDPHRIVVQDRRRDYGEERYRLLGMIDGRVYVVVYTVRGSAIRIISARKASGKEVGDYEHNARQD